MVSRQRTAAIRTPPDSYGLPALAPLVRGAGHGWAQARRGTNLKPDTSPFKGPPHWPRPAGCQAAHAGLAASPPAFTVVQL